MTTVEARPAGAERTHGPDAVLACVCACTILVMGLVAAINLAVPQITAGGLHPSSSQLLWIVDAYVVVFACLVIPAGAAGDRFGRKGVLLAGLFTFAAGAALAAAAHDVPVMLAARALTGLGAALVLPNCVGVLVHATAPERRGRALAVWGTVSGMGGLVGNTAGGALLAVASWRVMFGVVALTAVVFAVWVAMVAAPSARSARRLDPVGTVLLITATVALLLGIIEGPERGWGSASVVSAFIAGGVLGAVWIGAELRLTHPLLDPRLFRIPVLSSAGLGMFVTFFGSFGLFFANASLLQYGRGYSVLAAGLGTLPLAVPLLIGSRRVPGLARRFGIPAVLTVAFLAISCGLLGVSTATGLPYPVYAGWLVVVGTGFMLALPTLSAELTRALPAEQAGVAGGLQSATREFGSALGIAVVGTVLTAAFTAHLPAGVRHGHPVPRTVAEALVAAPGQRQAVVDAFASGVGTALRTAALLTALVGAVVVTVAVRAGRQRSGPTADQR
ncbi:MFS transporter [Streptomyces sp. NPDC088812]|uniref:MFS transporter n=1 Tax=Streptomyces sp. NPDC088812 TaxID=3365905 RepID=UPI00381743F6